MRVEMVPSRPMGGPRPSVIFTGGERSPAREIAKLSTGRISRSRGPRKFSRRVVEPAKIISASSFLDRLAMRRVRVEVK